jgi:hypothetical protein
MEDPGMAKSQGWVGGAVAGLVLGMITGCVSFAETPKDRFEQALKQLANSCATPKRRSPNDVTCNFLKMKPADPLATEEGRFAHSIQIPNPVPSDSGYKPGMSSQEYFDHLCKTEAGDFIFRTVENVKGVFQMRPHPEPTDQEIRHLYALEDPNVIHDQEGKDPAFTYVTPSVYQFFESPISRQPRPTWQQKYRDASFFARAGADSKYEHYHGYDGSSMTSMWLEYVQEPKSQYAYTWRGITRPHDRELGIAGGEVIVLDLQTKEVLAVRRRYLKASAPDFPGAGIAWGRVCHTDQRPESFNKAGIVTRTLNPFR